MSAIHPSVYIIADALGGHKIGVSFWGIKRVGAIYSPRNVARWGVAYTIPHPRAYKIERHAHSMLAHAQLLGGRHREWFQCSELEARNAVGLAWAAISGEPCTLNDACGNCKGFGFTSGGIRCSSCTVRSTSSSRP